MGLNDLQNKKNTIVIILTDIMTIVQYDSCTYKE